MIFLDTNIVIEYLKGNKSILKNCAFDNLYINDIVVMELYQGARDKNDLAFIKDNISIFKILKLNHEIVSLSTQIVERYNLSHNMKIMDALIASTVLIYNIKLFTKNIKDFQYINQIELFH